MKQSVKTNDRFRKGADQPFPIQMTFYRTELIPLLAPSAQPLLLRQQVEQHQS